MPSISSKNIKSKFGKREITHKDLLDDTLVIYEDALNEVEEHLRDVHECYERETVTLDNMKPGEQLSYKNLHTIMEVLDRNKKYCIQNMNIYKQAMNLTNRYGKENISEKQEERIRHLCHSSMENNREFCVCDIYIYNLLARCGNYLADWTLEALEKYDQSQKKEDNNADPATREQEEKTED